MVIPGRWQLARRALGAAILVLGALGLSDVSLPLDPSTAAAAGSCLAFVVAGALLLLPVTPTVRALALLLSATALCGLVGYHSGRLLTAGFGARCGCLKAVGDLSHEALLLTCAVLLGWQSFLPRREPVQLTRNTVFLPLALLLVGLTWGAVRQPLQVPVESAAVTVSDGESSPPPPTDEGGGARLAGVAGPRSSAAGFRDTAPGAWSVDVTLQLGSGVRGRLTLLTDSGAECLVADVLLSESPTRVGGEGTRPEYAVFEPVDYPLAGGRVTWAPLNVGACVFTLPRGGRLVLGRVRDAVGHAVGGVPLVLTSVDDVSSLGTSRGRWRRVEGREEGIAQVVTDADGNIRVESWRWSRMFVRMLGDEWYLLSGDPPVPVDTFAPLLVSPDEPLDLRLARRAIVGVTLALHGAAPSLSPWVTWPAIRFDAPLPGWPVPAYPEGNRAVRGRPTGPLVLGSRLMPDATQDMGRVRAGTVSVGGPGLLTTSRDVFWTWAGVRGFPVIALESATAGVPGGGSVRLQGLPLGLMGGRCVVAVQVRHAVELPLARTMVISDGAVVRIPQVLPPGEYEFSSSLWEGPVCALVGGSAFQIDARVVDHCALRVSLPDTAPEARLAHVLVQTMREPIFSANVSCLGIANLLSVQRSRERVDLFAAAYNGTSVTATASDDNGGRWIGRGTLTVGEVAEIVLAVAVPSGPVDESAPR